MSHCIVLPQYYAFSYNLPDIYTRVVSASQYGSRAVARDRKSPDFPNPIEFGAIDEDDRAIGEDFIRAGAIRAFEVLTFLVNGIEEPLKWNVATEEVPVAVTFTINHLDWMADNLPILTNERILMVIVEYALREWYKYNLIVSQAQRHDQNYQDAKIDLRTAIRLRKKPASRALPTFP